MRTGAESLRRNTRLTLLPVLEGFQFNPPYLTVVWAEDVQHHEFRMRTIAAHADQSVNGCVQVWLGPLLFAELPLSVFIGGTTQDGRQAPVEALSDETPEMRITIVPLFRKIFASYSHKDRDIVRLCEAAVEATGDRYLIDVKLLRSGDKWDERLLQAIDEADLFQLFWSRAAAASPYVEQEWQHALKLYREGRRKSAFIRPVYWSQKTPRLPQELADERIHFDRLDLERLGWAPNRRFWSMWRWAR